MMGAREQRRERTRQLLVDTAAAAFAERGFAAASLESVAAAAGVTKGALYHHFGSKEGLFDAVVRDLQEQVAHEVAARANEQAAAPWDGLAAGCRAFLVSVTDDRRRRTLLVDGPVVLGLPRWRQLDDEGPGRLLRDGLADLMSAGLLAEQPVEPLARLLSGAMNEAALWAGGTDRDVRLAQVDAALDRLLAGLRR